MKAMPTLDRDELPPFLARQLDPVCDQFEAAWTSATSSGPRPRIDDFLGDLQEPERSALLRELVLMDIFYRRQSGAQPQPADYAQAWLGNVFDGAADAPTPANDTPADHSQKVASAMSTLSATATPSAPPPLPEERYTRTRLHATGGLGRVWLARDRQMGREVALKELRPEGTDHPDMWARFLQEAQITGQLEHPSIVPVYEIARHPDNQQPFYTMRFVKGRTLSQACKDYHAQRQVGQASTLEQNALLNAFLTVCNVVAYAHSRGIVHRDLKGRNVVLGDFGEVIVLDWGLARVLGNKGKKPDETAKTSGRDTLPVLLEGDEDRKVTLHGEVLGTPGYMAPEQAAGQQDQIDERTDVYGLGALLYEILTGQPPFSGSDTEAVIQKVIHEAPVVPRALVTSAPAALQAVCLKALAKKPTDRYPTARLMAEDVQHFLVDGPVSSFREPLVARLRRWRRRHRTLVTSLGASTAVAVALLALLTGLLTAAYRNERAAKQSATQHEHEANVNFELALRAVNDSARELSADTRLKKNRLLRRQLLLKTVVPIYEKLVQQRSDNPGVRLEMGKTLMELGRIHKEINNATSAIPPFEQARAVFAQLAREFPADPTYRNWMASSLIVLGPLYRSIRDTEKAQRALEEGRALLRDLVHDYPEDRQHQSNLAKLLVNLGVLHYTSLRKKTEAEQAFKEAMTILERLVAASPLFAEDLMDLSNNYDSLATVLEKMQAEKVLRKALNLRKTLVDQYPQEEQYQNLLARSHLHLGSFYLDANRKAEAEQLLKDALTTSERLATDYPEVDEYRHQLARVHHGFGVLSVRQNQPDKARIHLEKAVTLLEQLPCELDYACTLAFSCTSLGHLFQQSNDDQAALPLYTQSIEDLEKVVKEVPERPDAKRGLADAYRARALVYGKMRCHAEAIPDWDRAFQLDDGTKRIAVRVARAGDLARVGDHIQASSEVEGITLEESLPANVYYDLACVSSLAAEAAIRDARLPEVERSRLTDKYASRALDLLHQAFDAGYKDGKYLKSDKDLDLLHERPDFKKLLADFESKGVGESQ